MSISTTRTGGARVSNPVKYYIEYRAGKGEFRYWNGTSEVILNELEFVVLDTFVGVHGYSKKYESNIYSNEIVSTTKEPFTVKVAKSGDVLVEGLWEDIKYKVKAFGGKFANIIYALVNIDGAFELCAIRFTGVSCNNWISFSDENGGRYGMFDVLINAERGEKDSSGQSEFYNIVFSTTPMPKEIKDEAMDVDKNLLQPYILARSVVRTSAVEVEAVEV